MHQLRSFPDSLCGVETFAKMFGSFRRRKCVLKEEAHGPRIYRDGYCKSNLIMLQKETPLTGMSVTVTLELFLNRGLNM